MATHVRSVSTNLGGSSSPRVLEGKFAIVTGASRGIGAAIAENLASKGCNLLLNYTSASSAEPCTALATTLSTTHKIKAHTIQADISSPLAAAHILTTAKNHFTPSPTHPASFQIDILINNAGLGGKSTLEESTPDEFTRLYSTNVLGPLLLTQAVAPYLPRDRSGRIVNLSSVSSSLGFVGDGIYGGTKAALEAMTRSWARELSERATVNAVNPGPVATDMYAANPDEFKRGMKGWTGNTPLARVRDEVDREDLVKEKEIAGGRPGYAHEVAGVVAMLCTPDSAWCTGSVVCANGGMRFGP